MTQPKASNTARSDHKKFVEMANPHAWLLTADRLHEQALYVRVHQGRIVFTEADISRTWDLGNKACFLLAGFALENAIKAFLVYENPSWISNGKLSKELRSHRLTLLQAKARAIPYKSRFLWVLKGLEAGLESWARYPCALSLAESAEEVQMTDRLWDGYCRLARSYGRRLQELLRRKWNGPHGWSGSYQFRGRLFLDCPPPNTR